MGRLTKSALLSGSDLDERDVELPKLGGSVRVRALPAAYSLQAASDATELKQVGNDQFINVNRAKLEILQALHGLVDPKLDNYEEAERFAQQCGPSFAAVIRTIDEISDVDKEAMTEAGERFPAVGTGAHGSDLADAAGAGNGGRDVPLRTGGEPAQNRPGVDDG